jgi:predicted metalloprotease with PDZ domain
MPAYRIHLADAHAHRWGVTLEVAAPGDELIVSLPVWIPGSYLVREFARHLLRLQAFVGKTSLPVEVIDKTTWRIRLGAGRATRKLKRSYEVYGFDPSVRASHLDAERGFFNGTSLLLRVHGQEQEPHRITLGPLPRGWQVATAMPRDAKKGYIAANYDEAVDHPFELGSFWRGSFKARGVEHEFVIAGAWPGLDGDKLLADTQKICEAQLDFWHGTSTQPANKRDVPFERYVFMLHAVDDGYGGLEHRASTALIASRKDLPRKPATASSITVKRAADPRSSEAYVVLLGLISHEYFHAWNVKRLKPAELASIDYTRENPTELLWFFEGFTSYYDDLILRRAGLIDDAQYLKLIAKQINGLIVLPGRKVQSVAQASFDAWTKYYRADENTPNLSVSYYVKGALVALALDLRLRTQGRGTLDEVMRKLWQASDAHSGAGAIDESMIASALQTVAGRSMAAELRAWVHGTDDPPWTELLKTMGVTVESEAPASLAAMLGLRVAEPGTGVQVKQVLDGGVAHRVGLSAGDEILAFDGWRLRKLDDAMAWWKAAEPFELCVVRDQKLRNIRVGKAALSAALPVTKQLLLKPLVGGDPASIRRRRRWLQGG